MRFRRLYWVTEQVDDTGRSCVTGVYTSIPALVNSGLRWDPELGRISEFRLSLVKLDSRRRPLGCWRSPDFGTIGEDLLEFVRTREFTVEECAVLVDQLRGFAKQHASALNCSEATPRQWAHSAHEARL